MNRQAVILAGGLGTRMYPKTSQIPKALLPVAGRPFIDWQLERLATNQYSTVLLCIGHLGHQIASHVGTAAFGMTVEFSEDGPTLLGTAGALRRALPALHDEFLVTYGDSYLPFDYASPLDDLRRHPSALGTMSVFKNDGRWDASNVSVSGDLVSKYEKGTTDAACDHIDYGATALRSSVIGALAEGERAELSEVQQRLAQRGQLRALLAHERFYEIGSEQGLRDLEAKLQTS